VGDDLEWSFASARQSATFAAAEEEGSPQTEHAVRAGGALCGLPEEQIIIYRSMFKPNGIRACPRCRELAVSAPTVPCGQERLHDRVVTAVPGALRTQLINALQSGADIRIWINGPTIHVSRYTHSDRITDGAEAVRDLLASQDWVSVARVAHPSGEFIVVLPQHLAPVIAFAAD
jgi:hypothetical protein